MVRRETVSRARDVRDLGKPLTKRKLRGVKSLPGARRRNTAARSVRKRIEPAAADATQTMTGNIMDKSASFL